MPLQPKQSWAVPRRAINLMEALQRSLAEDKNAEARAGRRRPARGRDTMTAYGNTSPLSDPDGIVYDRNRHHTEADWQFTTENARIKLKHLYPLL